MLSLVSTIFCKRHLLQMLSFVKVLFGKFSLVKAIFCKALLMYLEVLSPVLIPECRFPYFDS